MPWLPLATVTPGKDWAFTPVVVGSLFRVSYQGSSVGYPAVGFIAQASAYAPVELCDIRKIYSKQQYDIFRLGKPDCWTDRVLAVRAASPFSLVDWTVTIESWQSIDDIVDTVEDLSKQIQLLYKLVQLLF